jgi:hypothetical protein
MRKRRTVLTALLCAAAVTAVPFLGVAEAKKRGGIAGKFVGATEEGGTLTFKLTRSGKLVDFVLTNATLYCVTDPATQFPTREPEYTKLVTITHAPISMQGVSKKNPQGKKFTASDPQSDATANQGGLFEGKVVSLTTKPTGGAVTGMGFAGQVSYGTTNGPSATPGTERCATNFIDWEAKRPKDRGFVFFGGAGHDKPPLSGI